MILKRKNKKGFTLAEMMLAVAIIIILAGVVFINVANYLRSMALLERDGIAKEIFIAAQNHLTMAKGQGYLGITEFGTKDTSGGTDDKPVYYVAVNSSNSITSNSITSLMLPLGAVEETVRASGNYIIRYQPDSGRVLDVFYCSKSGRFSYNLGAADFANIIEEDYSDKSYRKDDFDNDLETDAVLGWFGAADADSLQTEEFENPVLELVNDDILYARVTNPNASGTLQIIVEGVTSGASGYFEYTASAANEETYLILDDITQINRHFSQIKDFEGYTDNASTYSDFIPGEDIRVYAKAFDSTKISAIGKSAAKTTNSLYEGIDGEVSSEEASVTSDYTKAYISNFRHLENLYDTISGMKIDWTSTETIGSTTFTTNFNITQAEQTADLIWDGTGKTGVEDKDCFLQSIIEMHDLSGFTANLGDKAVSYTSTDQPKVNTSPGEDAFTSAGCYLPINPSYSLAYDGCGCLITDVKIDHSIDAGLIGTMRGGSLSNMKLVNFQVSTSSGNAGALAGKLSTSGSGDNIRSADITNVIAYNDSSFTKDSNIIVTEGTGAAGGLVGYIEGNTPNEDHGDMKACGAALYVQGTGNAGGLIGTIDGGLLVQDCYAGGHTDGNGAYEKTPTDKTESDKICENVIGGGNAGGLIGETNTVGISSSKIINCYSTCSAYGNSANSYVGGLVGKGDGVDTFTNCYATGWVSGQSEKESTDITVSDSSVIVTTKIGAFAGNIKSGASVTNCNYFTIINERYSEKKGFRYLSAVSGKETISNITALDDTADTYKSFMPSKLADAVPYDATAAAYYDGKYPLKSVYQLENLDEEDLTEDYYVYDHYGDWPMPDVQVINTTTDS